MNVFARRDVNPTQKIQRLLTCSLIIAACSVFADGMVVPQVFFPKVEIPNQQALIHFANGTERLVIETSFLGEGTNFAWVVPLPSEPDVKPVSEGFFGGLQAAFQPRLVHQVHPYYAGILFLCGLAFLGCRCMRDEVTWVGDLPLCLLLGAWAWVTGGHVAFGMLGGLLALILRLFARSSASVAAMLCLGTVFSGCLIFVPTLGYGRLINTMGKDDSPTRVDVAGVTVLSEQHAGVFDATTIRGDSPSAILQWLEKNGYKTPNSAEVAIAAYVAQKWVFVASQVRRELVQRQQTPLHPLLFTFATTAPVYPLRLTAIDNQDCLIDLYVFGKRRAAAKYFGAARCDRIETNSPAAKMNRHRRCRLPIRRSGHSLAIRPSAPNCPANWVQSRWLAMLRLSGPVLAAKEPVSIVIWAR